MRYLYATKDGNIAEAAWKAIDTYSGFTGSTPGESGPADSGTAAPTDIAQYWKIGGYGTDGEGATPELQIMFSRQAIEAHTRKIASSVGLEAAMDAEAMQGINMESELMKGLEYESVAELDRELLKAAKEVAPWTTMALYSSSDEDDRYQGRWSQERFSAVMTRIIDLSNEIGTETNLDAANVLVASPSVVTALQSMNAAFNRTTAAVSGSTAMAEVGTFNGITKVYRDRFAKGQDTALLAYKGDGATSCGIVYCPYVTGVHYKSIDPNDFSGKLMVMSRYAITNNLLGAENYFRGCEFTGLKNLIAGVK